ncbi:YcgL domain-containing protein [Novilysobacter antarcticus]|uniref:YcgL domain-containing protein n=1 Tax=Novilysobacter antarcticus TaxID=2862543 RepID=UPI003CCD07A3
MSPPMHAYVYKSLRKEGAYVFLATRDDFERVSESVHQALQPFAFVLEVTLDGTRQLARGNADEVRNDLATRGFHVQMPPPVSLDPLTSDWGTDA